MIRTIQFELNKVSPVPSGLRLSRDSNEPASEVGINLAQLFLHHYFDSYLTQATPDGLWSSEFAWLFDGTVAAPATDFTLTGAESL